MKNPDFLMLPVCPTVKQSLKVYDGDDAVKRGCFRLVSIIRATRNEEVVVRASLKPFTHTLLLFLLLHLLLQLLLLLVLLLPEYASVFQNKSSNYNSVKAVF